MAQKTPNSRALRQDNSADTMASLRAELLKAARDLSAAGQQQQQQQQQLPEP